MKARFVADMQRTTGGLQRNRKSETAGEGVLGLRFLGTARCSSVGGLPQIELLAAVFAGVSAIFAVPIPGTAFRVWTPGIVWKVPGLESSERFKRNYFRPRGRFAIAVFVVPPGRVNLVLLDFERFTSTVHAVPVSG